jgi:ribonuclease HI
VTRRRTGAATHPPVSPELTPEAPSLVLFADGASRGNPGLSGAGAVLLTIAGEVVAELGSFLGVATNNVAEYQALLLGLSAARARGVRAITVRMDSELVVKQVRGTYQVKNLALQRLHARVLALRREFDSFRIEHVPRAENAAADRLANLAIDVRGAIGGPDTGLGPGGA